MELGRLEEIDVRKVWAHEQYDFSRWLNNISNPPRRNRVAVKDKKTGVSISAYACFPNGVTLNGVFFHCFVLLHRTPCYNEVKSK